MILLTPVGPARHAPRFRLSNSRIGIRAERREHAGPCRSTTSKRRSSGGSRASRCAKSRPSGSRRIRTRMLIDIDYEIKASYDRRTLVFPFYRFRASSRATDRRMPLPTPATGRSPLSGHRRPGQEPDPAVLSGMDRSQRQRSWRCADRAVRVDDGPAALSRQSGPGQDATSFLELIGVRLEPPRAARAPVTFYLSGPADQRGDDSRRDRGRDAADRNVSGDHLLDRVRSLRPTACRECG